MNDTEIHFVLEAIQDLNQILKIEDKGQVLELLILDGFISWEDGDKLYDGLSQESTK